MKILITGGTTFVSRYTAEYFIRKGHSVTVINRGSRPQVAGAELIKADRMQLENRLKDLHFDVVLDITAYTREHIEKLVLSGISFDDYIFISSSAVYPELNGIWLIMFRQPTFSDRRIFTEYTRTYTVRHLYSTVRCRTGNFICRRTEK